VRVALLGMDLWIATAEDTIVAKLEWAERSGSERQLLDVAGILEVQGGDLDGDYVDSWVRRLGLQSMWERVTGG
jgi:hypothetical protein